MRPESIITRLRPAGAALCGMLLAMLPGCSVLDTHTGPIRNPADEQTVIQATALSADLAALQRLLQAPAADQAELLAAAQRDYEASPSPGHQLRYALMLATPGHRGVNPGRAEQLLQPLATLPGRALSPGEQALAIVALQNVEHSLALDADNERLTQNLADRSEHEHSVANGRRLQQELDENAKLRKDLEEAKAKLDAIADIERGAARSAP